MGKNKNQPHLPSCLRMYLEKSREGEVGGVPSLKYLLISTSRRDHWNIIQHPTLRLCFSRHGPESTQRDPGDIRGI